MSEIAIMFDNWKTYFEENAGHMNHLFKSDGKKLSPSEKSVIFKSIQQFQKGENSEGKHLYNFAKRTGNTSYLDAIKLFIREEQRHALILGQFMAENNIPKIKSHWIDGVFRNLRKMGGLENSINVLLTAEVIAAVYYRALRDATENERLKAICKQILRDEEMHINFQSRTLGGRYLEKNILKRIWAILKKRTLMLGTICVVWFFHQKVLRKGGFGFFTFLKETWIEYLRSEYMQRGKTAIFIRQPSFITLG